MDRDKQLGNVAFGGDWAEEMLAVEKLAAALDTLERAVARCAEEDVRGPDLDLALAYLFDRIEKGPMIVAGLRTALELADPTERRARAVRLARQARTWAGL